MSVLIMEASASCHMDIVHDRRIDSDPEVESAVFAFLHPDVERAAFDFRVHLVDELGASLDDDLE